MKLFDVLKISLLSLFIFSALSVSSQVTAKEIIDHANELLRGKTSYSEMEMKVIRAKWERTLKFKAWSKGIDYSLILITYPAKEKGQVFLKRQKEMWNYIPDIDKMIKIPPSMMMQSWMGSDMTNDDLVKGASIVEDYSHQIIKEEKLDGYDCYVIELIPNEDAIVVWGKIVSWVTKKGYMTLRNEYYDEDGFLINTETLSKIKQVGDRLMPTYFEIVPEEKKEQKTTMEFTNVKFDMPINDSFFSIQNMKKIK
ncbi:outer membrane lipoprotein-sorting protein [Plebeiibacterium sediminum]|uniref:Outer membrane lipoprotein-sorting protein n=1 Tax=Plebeiibacterium sediminum TaxID=2992112 RepID=A0AAE3M413_9BACT|nr:outer membrane lipoprotein-sorting protein [Plebeiobacterium sediminum]MCW3786734.1 outer membrane lipoprotein-sorting protein [Plebeiobacterium sediminum]